MANRSSLATFPYRGSYFTSPHADDKT